MLHVAATYGAIQGSLRPIRHQLQRFSFYRASAFFRPAEGTQEICQIVCTSYPHTGHTQRVLLSQFPIQLQGLGTGSPPKAQNSDRRTNGPNRAADLPRPPGVPCRAGLSPWSDAARRVSCQAYRSAWGSALYQEAQASRKGRQAAASRPAVSQATRAITGVRKTRSASPAPAQCRFTQAVEAVAAGAAAPPGTGFPPSPRRDSAPPGGPGAAAPPPAGRLHAAPRTAGGRRYPPGHAVCSQRTWDTPACCSPGAAGSAAAFRETVGSFWAARRRTAVV